jgi:NADPH-dependent ferric siderophore reductase
MEYSHTAKPRLIPQPNPTQPTPDDYVNGLFTRYFCKKNNELKYMEIDQPTYTKLKSQDASIAWDLYTPVSIQWYIAGEIEKVYNVNKSIVNLVEVEEKWYGFSQYFKQDYAKYFAV